MFKLKNKQLLLILIIVIIILIILIFKVNIFTSNDGILFDRAWPIFNGYV